MDLSASDMGESKEMSNSAVGFVEEPLDLTSPFCNHSAKLINLQETLAENILLKRELRSKLEHIVHLRNELRKRFGQQRLEARNGIAENEVLETDSSRTERQRFFYDASGDAHSDFNCLFENSGVNSSVVFQEMSENEEGSTSTANLTISESIIEWVETNRSEVIETVSTGTLMVRDLALGGASGWVGAYVLKKFGTAALTALGGGLLLLQLANQGGYVVVDWNQIYTRLEQTASELEGNGVGEDSATPEHPFLAQIKKIRKWALDNRHFALGFLGGFVYKTYS